ncbi:MAG: antibiotic biosynthesis monooxygenase [Flavobacteriaceae bacterium]
MKPPYYAAIFTSTQTENLKGYAEMAEAMEKLAKKQPGYLGMEHARSEIGITISYWETQEAIAHWKANLEHQEAQQMGREQWYKNYTVRICKVEREYRFES